MKKWITQISYSKINANFLKDSLIKELYLCFTLLMKSIKWHVILGSASLSLQMTDNWLIKSYWEKNHFCSSFQFSYMIWYWNLYWESTLAPETNWWSHQSLRDAVSIIVIYYHLKNLNISHTSDLMHICYSPRRKKNATSFHKSLR